MKILPKLFPLLEKISGNGRDVTVETVRTQSEKSLIETEAMKGYQLSEVTLKSERMIDFIFIL